MTEDEKREFGVQTLAAMREALDDDINAQLELLTTALALTIRRAPHQLSTCLRALQIMVQGHPPFEELH